MTLTTEPLTTLSDGTPPQALLDSLEQPPTTRALTTTANPEKARVDLSPRHVDLQKVAQHMYSLMLRNVASDGFPFVDSSHTLVSVPGCVIAAPSYPANAPGISQDYVFHWIRDAAITALELDAAASPDPDQPVEALGDYVRFSDICQRNAVPTKGHACFTIVGDSRPWSEQNDGPAIQVVALLAMFEKLDDQARQLAVDLIARNLEFLLGVYREATTNLWEEHIGFSFFARSVQLRCFLEIRDNSLGIPVPAGVDEAISWLQGALEVHWTGTSYATMLGGASPGDPQQLAVPPGYDPNIDIVQAAIYGAVSYVDSKLLATAAQLIWHWADATSPDVYPINLADRELGLGPMLGRYPGDLYDGGSSSLGDHPWALCTANFAQLYYELANHAASTGSLPLDELSAPFFSQVGISQATDIAQAVDVLRAAGDAMLNAVVYHSDHLELSEQYDGVSGYEKSVRDLTWSYAAFLSAVRSRNGQTVQG